MKKAMTEEQLRLIELNRRFLEEVESGKGWNDLRDILEDIKETAKKVDQARATVVSFNEYPLNRTMKNHL
jgi:hypothetical protein